MILLANSSSQSVITIELIGNQSIAGYVDFLQIWMFSVSPFDLSNNYEGEQTTLNSHMLLELDCCKQLVLLCILDFQVSKESSSLK